MFMFVFMFLEPFIVFNVNRIALHGGWWTWIMTVSYSRIPQME